MGTNVRIYLNTVMRRRGVFIPFVLCTDGEAVQLCLTACVSRQRHLRYEYPELTDLEGVEPPIVHPVRPRQGREEG